MANPLTDAHIEGQRRLRLAVTGGVERIWRNLPGYDRRNVDEWLTNVLPLIAAGKRQSAALTDAYIARFLDKAPLGLIPEDRRGVDPAEVYERPFVTMWTALGAGSIYKDAFSAGLNRAVSTAAMDVQMAMRAASAAAQAEGQVDFGYTRVANPGACPFCAEIDGAYVKEADAAPLHNNCGCGLEPNTAPHRLAAKMPSGVAVHQHGELGPVLTAPDQAFTGPSDI
jgi:hypothetical protein